MQGRRRDLRASLAAIRAYERGLCEKLIAGLQEIPGLRVYGITDPAHFERRVPTVSFTLEGLTPREVSRRLGHANIFAWSGNFYALAVTERLGLEEHGGLLRVGLAHYSTVDEVAAIAHLMKENPDQPPEQSTAPELPESDRSQDKGNSKRGNPDKPEE